MKYLVNRETKEHLKFYDLPGDYYNPESWRVVEADDEGWIKWKAKKSSECPLPNNAKVEVLWRYTSDISSELPAGEWRWKDTQLTHYRPILPAESKPDAEDLNRPNSKPFSAGFHAKATLYPPSVFDRLSAAVAASESIPALIAEINAMLHPRFEVREKAKPEAVTEEGDFVEHETIAINPSAIAKGIRLSEDMSDWRNWREGDMVTCVNGSGWREFCVGGAYVVTWRCGSDLFINGVNVGNFGGDFKFHSRPEAK